MELIFKDRKFWPLFWTQFLGALNDNFFKNALVMLITYKSVRIFSLDSQLLVPLAGGIFIFPFFIFSATAGQMADKYQKATLIKGIKLAEIVIMGMATVCLYLDNYALLMVVLFLMGTQSAFFGPLKYGIIPSLVEEEKLVLGNAFVSAGTFIAILIGTLLGGSITELEEYVGVLSLGLLFFAALGALVSFRLVKVPIPGQEEGVSLNVDYTFLKPTWRILLLTMKDKIVFRTVLGISWYWFLGAATLSLLPLYAKMSLGGGPQVATLFLAIFTIGMGFGAYLTDKLSEKKVELGLVPISALGMSFFLLAIGVVGQFNGAIDSVQSLNLGQFFLNPYSVPACLSLFGMATFGGGYIVPQMSFLQHYVKQSELAQTVAGNNIWNALFMVIASLLIMILTKSIGINYAFIVLAALNFLHSFPLYSINSEKTLRIWMRLLSKVFYKVEVEGGEDFPEEGPVIIVSNHVSFVDWVILMGTIKRPIHFVIDWKYYFAPTGPFWFRQAGLVPIATRKESEEVLEKAFKLIEEDLSHGSVLGLFPEGWITRDGKMRKFQPGILKILSVNKVPVVNISLNGLWGSIWSFKGGRIFFKIPKKMRRRVKVSISSPIRSEDFDIKKAEEWIAQRVDHYESIPIKN